MLTAFIYVGEASQTETSRHLHRSSEDPAAAFTKSDLGSVNTGANSATTQVAKVQQVKSVNHVLATSFHLFLKGTCNHLSNFDLNFLFVCLFVHFFNTQAVITDLILLGSVPNINIYPVLISLLSFSTSFKVTLNSQLLAPRVSYRENYTCFKR